MGKNAIMLADTRAALVGTVLLQLEKTNPGLFHEAIIYYMEPIAPEQRERMERIMPCRFVKYEPGLPEFLFDRPRFRLFSPLMFCRYEMPRYLAEFDTVTWLDTDILIQGDLSEMIRRAEECGASFIREDPEHKTSQKPDVMRSCFTRDLPGFDTTQYLYCSGTIVLSRASGLTERFTQWCYRKTVQWSDILSLPDQGVINAAIQAFNVNVYPLSGSDYCCYPYMGRDCSQARIIHSWGLNKFWNDWYVYLHYPAWSEYYDQWLAMGGVPLPFEIAPRVSVVIPAYKPDAAELKECLDSLMAQKRLNWERFSDFEIIIVAEPGLDDEVLELLDSYEDKRIRLLVNDQRLGIAASLNRGLRAAKGRYIARTDTDDLCTPTRLFRQAEYLDHHQEITLCTTDFEYFGDMNERRVSFEGELSRAWSIFTCPFDHPTVMFRKDFFLDNGLLYDEQRKFVEDWELWLRAFRKGMRVGCIHRALFKHRWINAASAGQTNQTVTIMRETVQKNFAELGVDIPTEDLWLIGPWNGRLIEQADIEKLEEYFDRALERNELLGIYDQKCLEQVFALRMEEAKNGVLPGLAKPVKKKQPAGGKKKAPKKKPQAKKPVPFKRRVKNALKKCLKRFYRPVRKRFEEPIYDIRQIVARSEEKNWANEGHLYDCIAKLDNIAAGQERDEAILEGIAYLIREQVKLQKALEDQAALNRALQEQLDRMQETVRQ